MLTGLDLMFMGLTQSYSGRFSTPGFLVSPVGKRGMGAKKKNRKEGKREEKRKGRKGVGIKKDRRQNKKEFFNKN